jgi:hypothetical protein
VVLRDKSDPVAFWSHGSAKHGSGSTSTQSPNLAPNLSSEQSEEHEALMSAVALAKQQCAPVLIDKSDQQKLLIVHPIMINPSPRNRSDSTIGKFWLKPALVKSW